MKFIAQRDDMIRGIAIAQRAMPARSTLSALEGIYMEAREGGVMFKCSDMVLCIETLIEAQVSEKGALVLPGRLFSDIVRKLPEGAVKVEMGDNQIRIECGTARMNLAGMDPSEFPQMPGVPESKPIEIDQGEFRDLVRGTLFAVAVDDTKPILTGGLLEVSGEGIAMVALDGYRLALRKGKLLKTADAKSFVMPSKSLSEIAKLFEENEASVSIYEGAGQALIDMGMTRITTRLLEGEYIKYGQILPSEHTTRVRAERQTLLECIERAALLAREGKTNLVKLKIKEDVMAVTANSEMGSIYEEVPVATEGKELDIAFNHRYLTDVLKAMDEEDITLDFMSALSPCVIRPSEGESFLYLVLPVRTY